MTASASQLRALVRCKCFSRAAFGRPATTLPSRDTSRRLFHSTPARRLFDQSDQVWTAALGILSGWAITKYLLPNPFGRGRVPPRPRPRPWSIPPGSWLASANPETVDEIHAAAGAGFALAHSRPEGSRHEAFREATFQLPYEIARLNKDAQHFKIEDCGPVPPRAEAIEKGLRLILGNITSVATPGFDLEKDTRVFLYYPGEATKATAAFVALNTGLNLAGASPIPETDEEVDVVKNRKNSELLIHGLNAWLSWWKEQELSQSDAVERIESGDFPVIFLYRGNVSSCLFNTGQGGFGNPASMGAIMGFTKPYADESA